MKSLSYSIHRAFRFCINCSYLGADDSLLCSQCKELMLSEALFKKTEMIQSISVHYLLRWVANESRLVSLVVNQLKGSHFQEVYRYYARLLALNLNIDDQKDWVIVPCPSRGLDRLHARSLAKELSLITDFPLVDCLNFYNKDQKQKKKSKLERSSVQIQSRSENHFEDVIFIDDVVTTGATALASYQALGKPKSFLVGAIARRQLAADSLIW